MQSIRVVMTQGVELPNGGGVMQLSAGSYYLLPEDMAAGLIESRKAYPDGEPPTASDGAVFEGQGAWARVDAHEALLDAAAAEEAAKLGSVEFASSSAAELAAQHDLMSADFDFAPSGATGFTVADVRSVIDREE